jgi:hypothetical protein
MNDESKERKKKIDKFLNKILFKLFCITVRFFCFFFKLNYYISKAPPPSPPKKKEKEIENKTKKKKEYL